MNLIRPATFALLATSCAAAPAADPDPSRIDLIVMVSMDTTRADRMGGAFGNTRGLTPNLDLFAKEAVSFTDTWAVANLTSMSHAAIFTSRYASEVGRPGGDFHLEGNAPTLAGILGIYGWQTAAVTAGGHLARQFGLDRDFDWYQYTPAVGSFWHTVPAAFDWLDHERKPGPAFLFVHGYDSHTPYMAPAPFGRAWTDPAYTGIGGPRATASALSVELAFDEHLFLSEGMLGYLVRRRQPRIWDDAARIAARQEGERVARESPHEIIPLTASDTAYVADIYDGAVAYGDAMFGELVQGLKSRGLYDHTAIVVLSDHGESLGEAGRFGHGESVDPRELHVPLYIRLPGGQARVVGEPVSLLDVMPTVLTLAGAVLPALGQGNSLVPWLSGAAGPSHAVRFAEGNLGQQTISDEAGQLIIEGIHPGSPYFADAIGNADLAGPAFRGTGLAENPAGRAEYRAAILAWQAGLERPKFLQPASSGAVEEMKKHGYFTP